MTDEWKCRRCGEWLMADAEGGWTCPKRFDHQGAVDWQACFRAVERERDMFKAQLTTTETLLDNALDALKKIVE